MTTRQQLERHQVWVHLAAIACGLAVGTMAPALAGALEVLLWPVLGVLLYVTFTQVSLTQLPDAFRDLRFIGTVIAGNYPAAAIWRSLTCQEACMSHLHA
jgi:arsenite transporter